MTKKLRRNTWLLIFFILFGLNWAALHDILKGQPEPYAEYATVAITIVLVVYLIVDYRQRKTK